VYKTSAGEEGRELHTQCNVWAEEEDCEGHVNTLVLLRL